MSNLSMGLVQCERSEKPQGGLASTVLAVMSPLCVNCRRKISGKDGMFFYLPDPYFGLIHKECAPFFSYSGLWPHSCHFHFYATKSQRPNPGKTPSPGTV